jgi:hypothetical protein
MPLQTAMRATSLLTFIEREEEGLNETQEDKVYNCLKECGWHTSLELVPLLMLPINCITGRINALVKDERVEEKARKIQPETGRKAIVWGVT